MKPTPDQIRLDKKFLEWISYQPSIIDGTYNQYINGEGRNIACHVRRLSRGSGIGYKPLFSAIPLTDAQHQLQGSADGERKVLDLYLHSHFDTDQAAKWFEEKSHEQLEKWMNETGHNPFFYEEHKESVKSIEETINGISVTHCPTAIAKDALRHYRVKSTFRSSEINP